MSAQHNLYKKRTNAGTDNGVYYHSIVCNVFTCRLGGATRQFLRINETLWVPSGFKKIIISSILNIFDL